MSNIMVWKTNAFGSLRVQVLKVSTNGLAALVKFTRGEKYRDPLLPEEMWVFASGTLHKVSPRDKAEVVTTRATDVASTIKNRRVKALSASDEELVTAVNAELRKAPTKRAPKKAAAPQFVSPAVETF